MSSREWNSEAWELLSHGTRVERDSPEPDYILYSGKSCKACFLKRALFCRATQCACWGLLVVCGIFKLLCWAQQADDVFFREHKGASLGTFNILENEFSVFSHWRHDTIPITCHSHNGRGHHIPLQSAISSGCMSIEMTLFPAENQLLIGTSPEILSREINLRDIYIDPLLRMIREYNSQLETLPYGGHPHDNEPSGVFLDDLAQSLVLLIDFDADPERVWSQLIPHLEPLREAGFLSYFNGSAVVHGPITIVATGNVPFHHILERRTFRDIFFDAPLLQLLPLYKNHFPKTPDYSIQNSYCASADFRTAIGNVNFNGFSDKQLADVRQQVQMAHGLGLKVRYVGTPDWPHKLRNYVWRILVREGVDIITVDESSHRHLGELGPRGN